MKYYMAQLKFHINPKSTSHNSNKPHSDFIDLLLFLYLFIYFALLSFFIFFKVNNTRHSVSWNRLLADDSIVMFTLKKWKMLSATNLFLRIKIIRFVTASNSITYSSNRNTCTLLHSLVLFSLLFFYIIMMVIGRLWPVEKSSRFTSNGGECRGWGTCTRWKSPNLHMFCHMMIHKLKILWT